MKRHNFFNQGTIKESDGRSSYNKKGSKIVSQLFPAISENPINIRSHSQQNRLKEQHMLNFSLDSEDKKSPEKMLIKLTDKINEIEVNKLQGMEQ